MPPNCSVTLSNENTWIFKLIYVSVMFEAPKMNNGLQSVMDAVRQGLFVKILPLCKLFS